MRESGLASAVLRSRSSSQKLLEATIMTGLHITFNVSLRHSQHIGSVLIWLVSKKSLGYRTEQMLLGSTPEMLVT